MSTSGKPKSCRSSQEMMPAGTRYIVEDLIRKISGQDQLEFIKSLNLTLAKDGGKIKYIENLDKLRRLEYLNLSQNCIEKIEKLEKLIRLRELNLSFNCIVRIENLESLTALQVLNLSGNQIDTIPLWLPKRLKALRVFKIDKNQLQSLQDLFKLRSLANLVELSARDNPVSQLPHYRQYLVFHLRTVQTLDDRTIDFQERQAAHERFAQEELENLAGQLERTQTEYNRLADSHNKSLQEVEEKDKKHRALEETTKQLQAKLNELNGELEAKTNLLRKKTAEVTKACEKHYALEQELAFYKIDHKFETLSRPPDLSTPDDSIWFYTWGKPYIGKSRFRPNEIAIEQRVATRPSTVRHSEMNGSARHLVNNHSHSARGMSAGVQGTMEIDGVRFVETKSKIDEELQKKKRAMELIDQKLREQHEELKRVEERLAHASHELHRVDELKQRDEHKKQIYDAVSGKMSSLRYLQEEVRGLEQSMRNVEQNVDREEAELGQLYARLKQTSPHNAHYDTIRGEIATRERRLIEHKRLCQEQNLALQEKLLSVARETEEIQGLQEHITNNGDQTMSSELRQETENAVRNLNSYVAAAREKFDRQNEQFSALVKERVQMAQRIKELEQHNEVVHEQAAEISHLREQLSHLEESMREVSGVNQSLRVQLDESRSKDVDDTDQSVAAEQEIQSLRQALASLQDAREVEKRQYLQALELEKRKLNQLKHQVRNNDAIDQESRDLHSQLAELQGANVRLQDQLYAAQQKLSQQRQTSIEPGALKRRLEDVARALRHYREPGAMPAGAAIASHGTMTDDPVETAISELQSCVQAEFDKNLDDVNRALRAKEKMERKVAALKDEITQVQEQERSMAERAIQAVYENEKQEASILRDEVKRLENELKRLSQVANRNRGSSSHHHQRASEDTRPSSRSSSESRSLTRSSSASATGSSVTSSQWSARKRDLVNTMTDDERDLFNELQDEIEDLRRLLANQDINAMPKLEEARKKSQVLKTMIETRHRRASNSSLNSADSAIFDSIERQPTRPHTDAAVPKSRIQSQRRVNLQPAERDPVIDELRSVIDNQHNEIERLQSMLEQITTPHHQPPQGYHEPHQYASKNGRQPDYVSFADGCMNTVWPVHQSQHPNFDMTAENANPGNPYQSDGPAGYPYPVQQFSNAMQQPVPVFPNVQFVPRNAVPIVNATGAPAPVEINSGFPNPDGFRSYVYPTAFPQGVSYNSQPPPPSVIPVTVLPSTSAVLQPSVVAAPQQGVPIPSNTQPAAAAVDDSNLLMCNIPEHHHLEDYVAELQEKLKNFKGTGSPTTKQRQVSFNDDRKGLSEQAIRKLQRELNERQEELEALDLAVERQKEVCRRLSVEENEVLDKLRRSGSVNDVEFIRAAAHERVAAQRMHGCLADDDYLTRRRQLIDELECLEQTLASRQAELHEVNELLLDYQSQLKAAQLEAGDRRAGHENLAKETADLERRVDLAGTKSLALAAEIAQLQDDIDALREEKLQLNQTLADISDVIATKDAEFREVLSKLNSATERLRDVQSRLDVVSELEIRRLAAGQAQEEITKSRDELESILQKINDEQKTLQHVHSELATGQQDLQLLVEAIDKRHSILESLDSQLDSEITKRRQDIENAAKENERLLNEKQQLEEDIRKGRSHIDQISNEVKRAEDSLHQLKTESSECRSRLRDLDDQLTARRNELSDLERRTSDRRADTEKVAEQRDRINKELDSMIVENRKKTSELEKLMSELAKEKRLVERLTDQRKHLEFTVDNLKREKSELETSREELSERITELLRERTGAESLVRDQQQTLSRVNAELSRVESQIDETRRKQNSLNDELSQTDSHLQSRWKELDGLNADINGSRVALKAANEERERRCYELDDLRAQIDLLDSKTVEMKQVLQALTLELGQVSSQLADRKVELGELNDVLTERRRELTRCEMEIEMLEREAKQMQINKENFISLEMRIRNIAEELDRRMRDNDRLSSALQRAKQELDQRTTDMARENASQQDQMKLLAAKASQTDEELKRALEELKQVEEGSISERSSLQLSIQSHLTRANRLADEMSYLRAMNMELQRRLDTQEQIGERQTTLVEALRNLKSDLKREVTDNVCEIERSRLVAAELSELQSNNDCLRQCVDDLKQNLHVIQDVGQDVLSTSPSANAKDFFADHQELLKKQLRNQMQRHAEAVNSQKRLSQNTIHNLRLKLTNLEQVLSQTDAAKIAQLENSKKPASEVVELNASDQISVSSKTDSKLE